MRSASKLLAIVAMVGVAFAAFADIPPASKVMGDAKAKAKAENKNVLVMFDASW
jgi:hypothetical protein